MSVQIKIDPDAPLNLKTEIKIEEKTENALNTPEFIFETRQIKVEEFGEDNYNKNEESKTDSTVGKSEYDNRLSAIANAPGSQQPGEIALSSQTVSTHTLSTRAVDTLIDAIKSQELIWNYKIKEHSDITKKNCAWAAVCGTVIENFEENTDEEKNKIAMSLQKKWKVLRDGYSRYIKKMKPKSGSAPPKVRRYAYYEQLSFLKAIMENGADDTDSLTENEGAKLGSEENHNSLNTTSKFTKKKRKLNSTKTTILTEKLSERVEERTSHSAIPVEEDDDKLFLLSLLGQFKKIDDEYKLDARTEITNVIKYFKGMSHHTLSGNNRGYFAPAATKWSGYGAWNKCPSSTRGRSAPSTSAGNLHYPTDDQCPPIDGPLHPTDGQYYPTDGQDSPNHDQRSSTPSEDSLPPTSVLSVDIISNIFEE